jgi:signal transduction histidine kinase
MTDIAAPPLRLRAYLGARLRPLAVLVATVVATAAPAASFLLGLRALEIQTGAAARQVADSVRSDAEMRPTLWKYDALKLIQHLRSYEVEASIVRIDVVDARGVPIDPMADEVVAELRREQLLWQSEPVFVNNQRVAEVWVAMSTADLRNSTMLLFAIFGLLGATMAGMMYALPMRSVARAQSEIGELLDRLHASQSELAGLNERLERKVVERSAELSSAYTELQRKEHNLREVTSRAVELQEEERRQIARDLHDAAGQTLTAIRINLQLLADGLRRPEGVDRTLELARRTTSLVDETVEEIRRAVQSLGASVLEDVGLVRAIERMCDDVADRTGIVVERHIAPEVPLPSVLETTCYRVVQEALTNVMRHARATHVEVDVEVDDDDLRVSIADDGRGFAPQEVDVARSRGLAGMRERVELLGGRLDLSTRKGGGARVAATLPIRRA